MIEVRGLTHRYGPLTAVDDLDFRVERGEVLGLLGPNGAGKSTTIRSITGLLAPTRGQVHLGGHDVIAEPVAARQQLGYLPENVALYRELTVTEMLTYTARMKGVSRAAVGDEVARVVRACGLGSVASRLIGYCSRGYRQRVGLAQALLGDPPVLVLDEPTVGLDPAQVVEIRDRIQELSADKAVVLSTHILPEANLLCSRVLILSAGRRVAEGPPGALRSSSGDGSRLRVTCEDRKAVAKGTIEGVAGVRGVAVAASPSDLNSFHVDVDDPGRSAEIVAALVAVGCGVHEVRPEQLELEAVFLSLVRQESDS